MAAQPVEGTALPYAILFIYMGPVGQQNGDDGVSPGPCCHHEWRELIGEPLIYSRSGV